MKKSDIKSFSRIVSKYDVAGSIKGVYMTSDARYNEIFPALLVTTDNFKSSKKFKRDTKNMFGGKLKIITRWEVRVRGRYIVQNHALLWNRYEKRPGKRV